MQNLPKGFSAIEAGVTPKIPTTDVVKSISEILELVLESGETILGLYNAWKHKFDNNKLMQDGHATFTDIDGNPVTGVVGYRKASKEALKSL